MIYIINTDERLGEAEVEALGHVTEATELPGFEHVEEVADAARAWAELAEG